MAKPKPITKYILTAHAKEEMARRQISEDEVVEIMAAPEQIEAVRQGHNVY